MNETIRHLYEETERAWTWSYVYAGAAGFISGAVFRFRDWGWVPRSFRFQETVMLPWISQEIKWLWVAITVPSIAAALSGAVLYRQAKRDAHPILYLGMNLVVGILSGFLVAGTAGTRTGLAFGVAAISTLAIGAQALKIKLIDFSRK